MRRQPSIMPLLLGLAALFLVGIGMADRNGYLPEELLFAAQAQAEIYPTAAPAPQFVQPVQAVQPAQQVIAIAPTAVSAQAVQPAQQVIAIAPTAVSVQPVPAQQVVYEPTVIIVEPVIEQPRALSLASSVTLQGATSHENTSITIVSEATGNVVGSTITDQHGHFSASVEPGQYQIIAHSHAGSRLPACGTFDVPDQIPPTMLLDGGGFNTDETMNIGAAALFAIEMQLTIPADLVPILDANKDGIVNKTDAKMLINDHTLLACQSW